MAKSLQDIQASISDDILKNIDQDVRQAYDDQRACILDRCKVPEASFGKAKSARKVV